MNDEGRILESWETARKARIELVSVPHGKIRIGWYSVEYHVEGHPNLVLYNDGEIRCVWTAYDLTKGAQIGQSTLLGEMKGMLRKYINGGVA